MNAKTRRKFLKLGIYEEVTKTKFEVPKTLSEEIKEVEVKVEEELKEVPEVIEETKPKNKKNKKVVDSEE